MALPVHIKPIPSSPSVTVECCSAAPPYIARGPLTRGLMNADMIEPCRVLLMNFGCLPSYYIVST